MVHLMLLPGVQEHEIFNSSFWEFPKEAGCHGLGEVCTGLRNGEDLSCSVQRAEWLFLLGGAQAF